MKKNTEFSERFAQMLNYLGVNKNEFAETLKYNRSQTIYDIANGKCLPSFDFFVRFFDSEYSEKVNLDWLLKGEGAIDLSYREAINNTFSNLSKQIPLIPIEAIAGKAGGELTILESDIEQRYVIPEFHKADFLIRVKGNSMYPKYSAGDILACIRVGKEKWSYLKWNTAFVLDTDIGVMVKRILKSTNKKEWILRSDNKEYQDIEIPITSIYGISMVMGVIRFE